MGFGFSDAVIQTRRGPRHALVMTPEEEYLVGRERLEALRSAGLRSPIDVSLVERVTTARDNYRVVIFRGKSDDERGRWRLDETLDRDDLLELTRRLALSQLTTWRSLMRAGVWVMVHTDLGSSASPFREGSRALIDDPARKVGLSEVVTGVDEWMLRHLVFFFSGSFANVVDEILPDKLPLVELRADKLERLAEQLRVELPE